MVNGAAARVPEPLSTGAAPTKAEVEHLIGEATAAAAITLCGALAEFQDGGLTPATRSQGGERISWLYELQQATTGKLDFAAVMRREGKIQLRQRYDAAFRRCHARDLDEAALDEIIAHLLAVVVKVSAVERAMAN